MSSTVLLLAIITLWLALSGCVLGLCLIARRGDLQLILEDERDHFSDPPRSSAPDRREPHEDHARERLHCAASIRAA
ncbi:MAG TPA: hypothetical protein VID48_09360 [Solirubrobacteraceae bacterium]|jgi:hypothetical protein